MNALQIVEITLLTLVISHSVANYRREIGDAWKIAKKWLRLQAVKHCRPHQVFALVCVMVPLGLIAAAPVLFYGFELLRCMFVHD